MDRSWKRNSCFWKMIANFASVFFFFWRIRLRQPVCYYTPITIIRRISWAGLSVPKIYFYYYIFVRIFFSSIIGASIKLVRSFPWEWNKKTKQNKHTKEETLNLWIDLENWEFLETQGNLAFYVTALLEYVHLRFLKLFLWCYCLKRTPLTIIMKELKLMLWKFVW